MADKPIDLPDIEPTQGPAKEPAGAPIIQVQDLTAAYGDFVLMEHVTFDVTPGEIFIVLGGSGCGKSTLLKHMIGLMKPAAGRVLIDGMDMDSKDPDVVTAIRRKIGVGYQSGALFGSMTLMENVRLPMEEFTDLPDEAMDLIARLKLSLVGLSGYGNHMPSELSGGMKKRAAIARAMALDPMILFLDEPSAGLDPVTSAELDKLILGIRESLGMTFVVVTHELPSIYTIADKVIMLDKRAKGIIDQGRPDYLRDHSTNPWVRQFFNRQAELTE